MDIERLSAAIRPRNTWEAMDLGFALARRWFLPLWGLWWLTAALPALLLLLWLHGSSDLWLLALWWLKPLFEAPLLAWLARALFGERLGLGAALHRLPSAFPRRLWPHLLWRRFSLARSFTMPVTLLERQQGRGRRARLRALTGTGLGVGAGAGQGSGATWLTLICVHLETVLWLSMVLLLVAMVPAPLVSVDFSMLLFDEHPLLDWTGTLLILLAMSLMAPFYVAAGFALYLGRRTALEAWDLELAFRRVPLVGRRPAGVAPGAIPAALPPGLLAIMLTATLMAGTLVGIALPGAVVAQTQAHGEHGVGNQAAHADASAVAKDAVDDPLVSRAWPLEDLSASDAEAIIDTVLADPDFGEIEERAVWTYVGPEGATTPADGDAWSADWLPIRLLLTIAEVVKWLLLIGLAAVILLLVQRLVGEWRGRDTARRRAPATPATPAPVIAQHAAPAPGPLPPDLPGAVQALLAAGETRAALALLYRAQIAHLRGLGLAIPDSATEADCLAAAARVATSDEGDWLARLTGLWQRVAYGHQPVAGGEVRDLLAQRPTQHPAQRPRGRPVRTPAGAADRPPTAREDRR